MITAIEALERLKEGNQRFIDGLGGRDLNFEHVRRLQLVEEQHPFAIVLGCSDSRVPLELIFDQGLGDLFVVRVAGNIVARSQVGSIEFAAEKFGTPLVVILGHTGCGAIEAAVDDVLNPSKSFSPNLELVVDEVRPTIHKLIENTPEITREGLLDQAVRANVQSMKERLISKSELLRKRVNDGQLMVVGAEYSLQTGMVEYFI